MSLLPAWDEKEIKMLIFIKSAVHVFFSSVYSTQN